MTYLLYVLAAILGVGLAFAVRAIGEWYVVWRAKQLKELGPVGALSRTPLDCDDVSASSVQPDRREEEQPSQTAQDSFADDDEHASGSTLMAAAAGHERSSRVSA